MNVLTAWRRFLHLAGPDRATLLEAAVCLSATWMALRLIGFRRWNGFLARMAVPVPPAATDPAHLSQALHITRLASAAARHLFVRTNCLEQAMTLCVLLQRRGLPAVLRFGARKHSAHLEAHAWVEYLGVPLNEDSGEHRHFLPFAEAIPVMETLPD